MKQLLLLVGFSLLTAFTVVAQSNMIFGKVTNENEQALASAHVLLTNNDTGEEFTNVTDPTGRFRFRQLADGIYTLKVSFLGYREFTRQITTTGRPMSAGDIVLKEGDVELEGVEIEDLVPQAIQKGDTTQFNADAFKTLPDANAEDLVKKMPTVTTENGKVQAQGEDVKEVLVDGRPFFGNDPTAALRNLPAEVIDKIQIFDKQSDQSQFTGFDDGNTSKTINIITRKDMRNGQFGQVYAGYGYEDRYRAGGNINLFNKDQRISFIGQSNNINQQNFATEDLLGVVGSNSRRGGFRGRGGGRGRGGRGGGGASVNDFLVDQQGGIAQTHAIGLNYTDEWGEKFEISGSYFFNRSDTDADELIDRTFVDNEEVSETYEEENFTNTKNTNHRINMRLEYDIDSFNSIIMRPRLSIQQNKGTSTTFGQTNLGATLLNQTDNTYSSDLSGIDFSNNLLWRHRFKKRRRTLSFNLGTTYSDKNGESFLNSRNGFYENRPRFDTLDQRSDLDIVGWSGSASVYYTEPIGKMGMLMANYRASYREDDSAKETFDFDEATDDYSNLNEPLSNTFRNEYFTQSIGAGYNYRKRNFMFMFRANVQRAELTNQQLLPIETGERSQKFDAFLPFAMIRYGKSRANNLRIFYRTNTDQPSIEQLQNVVDNSNPLQLSVGNPDLDQSYSHRLFLRYSNTNPQKSTVFFALVGGSFTDNRIVNSTYLTESDAPIFDELRLEEGAQLTRPVNMDGYWDSRVFLTYGFPLRKIKSNLNTNISFNHARIPGLIDEQENFSNNSTAGLGLVLSSNISDRVDFTLSSKSNYNVVTNTLQGNLNTEFFNQNSSVQLNWLLGKGIIFRTDVNHQFYDGLSEDFDQNFVLWNIGIGKKLFKNDRGELFLSVFDLLKENNSVNRQVTEVFVEDTETQVLQRYIMLTFTYNVRHFRVKE